jgi:hypothetical protein
MNDFHLGFSVLLLVIGYWLLVIGYWLLVIRKVRLFILSSQKWKYFPI